MSLPIQHARQVVQSMQSAAVRNLIAQAKAKQVLREVHEIPANFPNFFADLDERVTFVAYALLAAGCSFIEQQELVEGYAELQSAADILESAHRTEAPQDQASAFHCLIGAMAFYACGQYSRAFVLIKGVESVTPAAGIIASFLRKDSGQLVSRLNDVLLTQNRDFEDSKQLDEWALTTALARAIALIFEHNLSGQAELLEAANTVLRDAMIIAENGAHPAYWWLARMLKLMLDDYEKGSLWNILPPFFDPDGASRVENYVRLLALSKPPVTELWQSQLASLTLALNTSNSGGVINLRTSAGKTRVAELAILQTLKNNPGAKVLYLAPFRSLAFEMERTFGKFLSPLGYSISHLYGGLRFSGVDRELVNETTVIIATPEKAKAMLRAAPELFEEVKLIIVDEGHLLGANERNIRNELFLEHLRLKARQWNARILLLSAVLPNATELASWIGGDPLALAKSNWKPSAERFGFLRWTSTGVAIEWIGDERCFNPHFVEFRQVPKGNGTRRFPKSKTEAVAATAARLAELGPVLIFAGQAQWVASMAKNVLLALGADAQAHPWPEVEWKILEAVCREELGEGSLELEAARLGVICHCNNLPPQVRISIEKLMAKKAPRIIVATTTLGQGVNIGISSVIVSTTYIGKERQISKRDFWNICGRAGRAFVDGEGKILFAIDGSRNAYQIATDEAHAKTYFDIEHLDNVESGLFQVLRVLKGLAAEAGISFDVLLELVANNDFQRFGEKHENIPAMLDWIDDQILALHVAYKGADDASMVADWVDDAFQQSFAAIQEHGRLQNNQVPQLLPFLKARATGVLLKVPSPIARRAVVASGLPLSVALLAFDQLDVFRTMVDEYLSGESEESTLSTLVAKFEAWARENAKTITGNMPDQTLLDQIRPKWLGGVALRTAIEQCGDDTSDICTEFYGFELPWLLHSVAQKLDRLTEENRVEALSLVSLLVELGLPTEAAAKVFLAGVRSRTAAVELGPFVANPSASITRIRNALLDPATVAELAPSLSPSTLDWLNMLSLERDAHEVVPPTCAAFNLDAPDEIELIHVRKDSQDRVYLCSTDGRFKCHVSSTDDMPFARIANDSRVIFVRDSEHGCWRQKTRDPRIYAFER